MSGTAFRSGAECNYPLPHARPDARSPESLANSVTAVLIGYDYPRLDPSADRAVLASTQVAFLYDSLENRT
ncbi:hypothetical protein SAMN05216489_05287 [Streptomyces sp. 3213]|nr:hypothetical protein SAMN05216489_05287 [Streptomyces sp. 3213] [Streptomyces sp. 3213.3]